MSAQLFSKAYSRRDSQRLVTSVRATCQSHIDGMSSDSREVDSKILNQVRFRRKEQVFRRIHVIPYREREAWSQVERRKSAFKGSFQL